jgi:hypothetical protein
VVISTGWRIVDLPHDAHVRSVVGGGLQFAAKPRAVAASPRTVCRSSCSYSEREGPRGNVQRLEDGAEVKLGVFAFLSNSKSRRRKLSAGKLQQLANLGLEWAGA